MFDPKKVDLRKDPTFYLDVKDQVKTMCTDFGKVQQVHMEQDAPEGRIWVKFDSNDIRGAVKTQESLDNQYFDHRLIRVFFVSETVFNQKSKER